MDGLNGLRVRSTTTLESTVNSMDFPQSVMSAAISIDAGDSGFE
jgi:hypothetical protein